MAPDLSDLVSQTSEPSRLARDSEVLRTLTLAEGMVMLVLGFLSLIFPAVASVWVTAMVAIGFLVSGIVGWVNTVARSSRLSGTISFWRLTVSTLFVVAGAWMVHQLSSGPVAAAKQVAALAAATEIGRAHV